MGSDEDWEDATNGLKAALEEPEHALHRQRGRRRVLRPEDRLPPARTVIGRTWQCGTIQLDFQMPLNVRPGIYRPRTAQKQRPIMIHRVVLRLHRALHRHPDRALRRQVPDLAGSRAGEGAARVRQEPRLCPQGVRGAEEHRRACRAGRPQREDRLQDSFRPVRLIACPTC